jgi:putative PIN family toxin of toxin-antitoxin system
VVLDSSVLIAAAISRGGVCANLFEDVLTHHELVVSDFIVTEVARKLRDKFQFPEIEIRLLRRFLNAAALSVKPAELPLDACRDPLDVPVLGTAVAAASAFIVTVDKDLLALKVFHGIAIIKPGEFWARTTR